MPVTILDKMVVTLGVDRALARKVSQFTLKDLKSRIIESDDSDKGGIIYSWEIEQIIDEVVRETEE